MSSPPDIAEPLATTAPATVVTVRASDPRLRLHRHLLGERAHRSPEMVYRLEARGLWQDPTPPVPDRERAVRSGEVRETTKKVDPAPNAPQLIRLVRTPFALETVRPVRDPDSGHPARIKVGDLVRVPFGLALREALDDGRREPFPNATDSHPPLPRRQRPSAAAWLEGR